MTGFFGLLDNVHIKNRWHLGEVLKDGNAIELWRGEPVESRSLLKATLERSGRPLIFSLTSFAAPIARIDLANEIASISGKDLQRLPVAIDNYEGYEVLNSVRIVPCLNEAESEFMKWTEKDHRPELAGQYRMVTKLKIDPKRVPSDAHFFRIDGWRISLIVSQTVKIAMESVGCLGAAFQRVA